MQEERISLTIHKVPETIRLITLIRQFLRKPKSVISLDYEGDYDETALKAAYGEIQLEHIDLLMPTNPEDGVTDKLEYICKFEVVLVEL